MTLYYIILYYTILYIILYLCYIIFILYYFIFRLYFIILYHIISYHIILYCISIYIYTHTCPVKQVCDEYGAQNTPKHLSTGWASRLTVPATTDVQLHICSHLGGSIVMGVPSGYVNSLLLKMAIEIVSFPMNSMVIFYSKLLVYQRVSQ